jgi:RNA polymerase sigma-70 factor (ECF subfamily)
MYEADGTGELPAAGAVTADQARRRAFERLVEAYRLDIASYCCWRAASISDAEDAVAEVFLVAWRRHESIPAGEAARAWLYATARRVLANQRRSVRRRAALRQRLAVERVVVASDGVVTSAEEVAVHEALGRLADRDREVLLLAEWEGLDTTELATVLRCGLVTARGRLHRARRRFRGHFHSLLHQPDEPRPDHPTALLARESPL